MWGPFGILTALGLALAPVAGSAQTDQTETPTSVEAQTVSALPRNITLSELGFSSGITFTGLFGDAEMFFPLPDPAAVIEAELVLQIEHAETSDGDRFFQVLIGDRLVATVDLDKRRSPTEVRIPVSPSLARGGFLETRIRYSGALSDRICVDERASGDFFLVDAESHLELALDPDALDRPDLVAGFQPPHVHVSLPDGDVTAAALTAALRAGTIYNAQNGLVTYGAIPDDLAPIWTRADLEIAEAGSVTGFAAGLQAVANRR
ncbi:MAG: cellulose biosynthesis cyclic di-GMP-binding regulatory protein BcsB, partial [Pseudomonadota bacterium]